MRLLLVLLLADLGFLSVAQAQPASGASDLPVIIKKAGRYSLQVDGKPYLILGGQCHNSSAWPAMMPKVWQAVGAMHANTLEAPVYWEQLEPLPGSFDFSVLDTLLSQARSHNVRLVLLWFATWKNGSNHYMPAWMKADSRNYPNIVARDGSPRDSPAPDAAATLAADKKAFAALMRHLKSVDPQHTVIMVQVENEPGAWDTVRDFSPSAQKSFEGPVPAVLLQPAILEALHVTAGKKGSWKEVFGDRADEYFHAWSVAAFIGKVAAAGKAEYPLPLYVNAALRDPLTDPPATNYESGGPTDNVIPIWKAAAPAIDLLAPDIYLDGSERVGKVIDLYDRPDNPLFIPEAGLIPVNMKYLYAVIGHGGLGFSPFGIDDNELPGTSATALSPASPRHHDSALAALAHEYELLGPMSRDLAQWALEGRTHAVVEPDDHKEQTIDLGDWQAAITFGSGRGYPLKGNTPPTGKVLLIRVDANRFLVTGTGCRITFRPRGANSGKPWQYLKVEEGRWADGRFEAQRILNGDETDWGGPLFGAEPTLIQISLQIR